MRSAGAKVTSGQVPRELGTLSLHGHTELNSANNQTDLRRKFFPESPMQSMSVLAFDGLSLEPCQSQFTFSQTGLGSHKRALIQVVKSVAMYYIAVDNSIFTPRCQLID